MDDNKLIDALSHLDPSLIEDAAQPVVQHKTRFRSALVAACLCLLIAIPTVAVTGNLLVEHYCGNAIPNNLAEQDLDAFFRVNTTEKVHISLFSQKALDTASNQEEKVCIYGFKSWDEAEEFLGLNILDSDQIQNGYRVPVTDTEGNQLFYLPCHLTMLRSDGGLLYSLNLDYFFHILSGESVSLHVNAVTDQFPGENNSSIGVDDESADVLQQINEDYLTASGNPATILSTEYSDGHGWTIDGWTQNNGFVIRFSLSTYDEESGIQAIQKLLDSIQ